MRNIIIIGAYLWQEFPTMFSDHIYGLQDEIYNTVFIEIGKIDSSKSWSESKKGEYVK